jgi:hypothetical protein
MLGIFENLSIAYKDSSTNMFEYTKERNILIRPILYLVALAYSFVLYPIGLIFGFLTLLDDYTESVDRIRRYIVNSMDNYSYEIRDGIFSFIFKPILFVIHIPLFIISLMIPKLSGVAVAESVAMGQVPTPTRTPIGAFKEVTSIIWRSNKNLYGYGFKDAFLLLKPLTIIIALIYSIAFILAGLVITLLIPLDWISKLIDLIRSGVVNYVNRNKNRIRNGLFSFLFIPALLTALAPLFLLIIIVPKFSSTFTGNSA